MMYHSHRWRIWQFHDLAKNLNLAEFITSGDSFRKQTLCSRVNFICTIRMQWHQALRTLLTDIPTP